MTADPPNDLASCLDTVLGPESRAYVLTDNEPGSGYEKQLQDRIAEINLQNVQTQPYSPLVVDTTKPELEARSDEIGPRTTELNGVPLTIGHQGSFAW